MRIQRQNLIRVSAFFIALIGFSAAVELISYYLVGGMLVGPDADYNFLFYGSEIAAEDSKVAQYFAARDQLLGWPPTDRLGTDEYDVSGSRPIPAFPDPAQTTCVSLYGDSYTYGQEVSNEHAWSNHLSEHLGCRVSNYGVNGYGPDQAYLRFRYNEHDKAELIVLGIFHDNILRIVNTDRRLIFADSHPIFKPRFVLNEGGEIDFVPIPDIRLTQIDDYAKNPVRYLSNEWLLPDSADGPTSWSFPYSLALAHAALSARVRNVLMGRPSWSHFYDPEHPSQAVELMVQIVKTFNALADQRGQRFLLVMFPSGSSFRYAVERGINVAAPVVAKLREDGIEVVDMIEQLSGDYDSESYCELLTTPSECHFHYNNQGNEVAAKVMYDYIHLWGSPTQSELIHPNSHED